MDGSARPPWLHRDRPSACVVCSKWIKAIAPHHSPRCLTVGTLFRCVATTALTLTLALGPGHISPDYLRCPLGRRARVTSRRVAKSRVTSGRANPGPPICWHLVGPSPGPPICPDSMLTN